MLENALRAARMEESSINREKQDFKHRLKELTLEMNKLRGEHYLGLSVCNSESEVSWKRGRNW